MAKKQKRTVNVATGNARVGMQVGDINVATGSARVGIQVGTKEKKR